MCVCVSVYVCVCVCADLHMAHICAVCEYIIRFSMLNICKSVCVCACVLVCLCGCVGVCAFIESNVSRCQQSENFLSRTTDIFQTNINNVFCIFRKEYTSFQNTFRTFFSKIFIGGNVFPEKVVLIVSGHIPKKGIYSLTRAG